MAEETKKTPQTPEEIAREAQAQAMKAALEQAQALYGNVPGFEGTDLMKMHEKLMQDSAEMFPGVAEAQAYQAKMMAESAQDPEAIMETYSKNIEFAGNMMQQAMNAGFMPEGLPDFSDGFDVYAGWEITRKGDNSLTPEQNRLLAYGAPLFLYNDDNVDSLESTAGTDTLKEMLEEWWEVTDRKSALETISWLLNEGQHAGADPALTEIRQRGIEAITEEEKANEASANHRILRLWRTRLSNVWCSVYGIWPRMTVSAALSSPQSISNVPVPETSHCTDTSAADNEKTAVCGQVKCLG